MTAAHRGRTSVKVHGGASVPALLLENALKRPPAERQRFPNPTITFLNHPRDRFFESHGGCPKLVAIGDREI